MKPRGSNGICELFGSGDGPEGGGCEGREGGGSRLAGTVADVVVGGVLGCADE